MHLIPLSINAVDDINVVKHLKDGISVVVLFTYLVVVNFEYLEWQFFELPKVDDGGNSVVVKCEKVYLRRL
jgi:hypothetical protein